MRMMIAWACGLSLLAALPMAVQAQPKNADPSGTWRWDLDMNGNTVKNVLKLEVDKDGKLTGTLQANDRELRIEEGKVVGDKVSFFVTLQLNQTVKVNFQGKQTGDALKGDITAKSDEGDRSFAWDAKRSVDVADVAGVWDLKIETPNGNTLTPVLTITQTGEELKGSYENDGKKIEAQELRVKDNNLYFQIDTKLEQSDLHVEFKGRPYGSKLNGTLEYSVNGDTGELDFTGVRKSAK